MAGDAAADLLFPNPNPLFGGGGGNATCKGGKLEPAFDDAGDNATDDAFDPLFPNPNPYGGVVSFRDQGFLHWLQLHH